MIPAWYNECVCNVNILRGESMARLTAKISVNILPSWPERIRAVAEWREMSAVEWVREAMRAKLATDERGDRARASKRKTAGKAKAGIK